MIHNFYYQKIFFGSFTEIIYQMVNVLPVRQYEVGQSHIKTNFLT